LTKIIKSIFVGLVWISFFFSPNSTCSM